MALRRFNAGGKKQKELTEEQKQEIKEAFGLAALFGVLPSPYRHVNSKGTRFNLTAGK